MRISGPVRTPTADRQSSMHAATSLCICELRREEASGTLLREEVGNPRRNRRARAALAAELLLLGDARHPHMGHRAGDAAGAPLTARSQDTSTQWPAHVHTLLMSTEPSHKPEALRHAPRGQPPPTLPVPLEDTASV